ncbi:MAG: M28 family peptidase [Saprospiraceae bacterium]|nr:M28 family peptidase [Saprospiraceae bacterium]MCF8248582.1 M28 family peptidase [Saprospiraceae bacterium]MCF8280251.1 M28 family peptidase [Bacteroidales bacterium]MCF8310315.1 M28 family peptidase [Saprospiraceae bacterium]MCF8439245.1 M28 family peptidase [Saprospiraceae bacterium]
MKFNLLFLLLALLSAPLFGQNPAFNFDKNEVETNLKYLASDELGGRRTGSKGEQLAADFISEKLESYGVKPVTGRADFIQKVPFTNFKPPKSASLKIGINNFTAGSNLLIINGKDLAIETEIVFVGNGWVDEARGIDDYKGIDVKGKIVLTITGTPDGNDPAEVMRSMPKKQEFAANHGAIALLEAYRLAMPWQFAKSFFGKERMDITKDEAESNIIYGWVQEQNPGILQLVKEQENVAAKLNIVIGDTKKLLANNIVGIIEGTDDSLKNEYIILSAHFDHIGMGRLGGAAFTPQDSIFNGARDNCIGTVALMAAAKELAANPPKRSVLILACTAEEMGMLGSQWYADHPLLPMDKMVFNLNNDGAGYNSTEHFNVIGMGFTNVDKEMKQAGLQVGLNMLGDPAPEQNLYERSDNISFARLGIPAVDFAPGIKEMDEEVYKYYHQATDNADSLDYDYVLKFCQAYTLAARMIADKNGKIDWQGAGKQYAK